MPNPVRIIYKETFDDQHIDRFINDEYDYVVLKPSDWDDYSYQTTFELMVIKDTELYDGFIIKIAFEDQGVYPESSRKIFEEVRKKEQKITIDIEEVSNLHKFISMIGDYEEINKIFQDEDQFHEILRQLNDALYLKKFDDSSDLLNIIKESVFQTSVLRDQYFRKMFYEGLDTLSETYQGNPEQYYFNFEYDLYERHYDYKFDFRHEKLPSRINILIGKNGAGKTKTLEKLVEYLINPRASDAEMTPYPEFLSNLIVFSYNPYENFYVYRQNDNISIEYKYIGFRRYKTLDDGFTCLDIDNIEVIKALKIIKEKYHDRIEHFNSLSTHIIKEDFEEEVHIISTNESLKKESVHEALKRYLIIIDEITNDVKNHDNISFESIVNLSKRDLTKQKYSSDTALIDLIMINIQKVMPQISTIALRTYSGEYHDYENVFSWQDLNKEDYEKEIYFLNDEDNPIFLSSGQKVYTNLIINLFSIIKNNSLIIIDEPENTLHPQFEIGFMKILQGILEVYNSFALIATHSSIITREVPTDSIHIIVNKDNEIEIQKPLMTTFGANITSISNYIFDDVFSSDKPYSSWLEKKLTEYESFEEFKNDYEKLLSYELMSEAYQIMDESHD